MIVPLAPCAQLQLASENTSAKRIATLASLNGTTMVPLAVLLSALRSQLCVIFLLQNLSHARRVAVALMRIAAMSSRQ
jgi:hypothetical protein